MPDPIADARASLIAQGMDPEVAAHIPQATLQYHLNHHVSMTALYAICEGRPDTWVEQEQR